MGLAVNFWDVMMAADFPNEIYEMSPKEAYQYARAWMRKNKEQVFFHTIETAPYKLGFVSEFECINAEITVFHRRVNWLINRRATGAWQMPIGDGSKSQYRWFLSDAKRHRFRGENGKLP